MDLPSHLPMLELVTVDRQREKFQLLLLETKVPWCHLSVEQEDLCPDMK